MPKISIIIPAYNAEDFLPNMLNDIKAQIFSDYEVIIINDGSTDGTQSVIDEFCKGSEQFKSYEQVNQGVSAARNKGLDMAQGDYVVFYDADDSVPEDALQRLIQAVGGEDMDLVIGKLKITKVDGSRILRSTEKLAKRKKINRFDHDMLWSFSVCNKMFRRQLIQDLDLRFDTQLYITEDSLFLLQYFFKCEKVTGCGVVVYEYIRRPFWRDASATQKLSKEFMDNQHKAFVRLEELILENVNKETPNIMSQGEIRELECEKLTFLSKFYKRYIASSLINARYRKIWWGAEDIGLLIAESVAYCRGEMFPSMWNHIVKKESDLQLEKGILNRQQIAVMPVVSIVINESVREEDVDGIVDALYKQELIFFEVLMPQRLHPHIRKEYQSKENMHILQVESALPEQIKGKYIMFVDDRIWLTGNSLIEMIKTFDQDSIVQCAVAPVMKLEGDQIVKLDQDEQKRKILSNKLFPSQFATFENLEETNVCEKEAETFVLQVES